MRLKKSPLSMTATDQVPAPNTRSTCCSKRPGRAAAAVRRHGLNLGARPCTGERCTSCPLVDLPHSIVSTCTARPMAAVLWHFGIPTRCCSQASVSQAAGSHSTQSPTRPQDAPLRCAARHRIAAAAAAAPSQCNSRRQRARGGRRRGAAAAAVGADGALPECARGPRAGVVQRRVGARAVLQFPQGAISCRWVHCLWCATRGQCASSTVSHIPQNAICTVRHCRVACQEMQFAASCMPTRIHHNNTPAGGAVHMPRLRGRRRSDAPGGRGAGRAVARCGSGAGPWGNLRLGGAARGAGRGELLSDLQHCSCSTHRNLAAHLLLALTAKQVHKNQ